MEKSIDIKQNIEKICKFFIFVCCKMGNFDYIKQNREHIKQFAPLCSKRSLLIKINYTGCLRGKIYIVDV